MADDLKLPPESARGDDAHAEPMGRATFTAFTNATPEDWMKIASANEVFKGGHVDRILAHLNLLKGDCGGFPIDRLEHSLQTATRASVQRPRDGQRELRDRRLEARTVIGFPLIAAAHGADRRLQHRAGILQITVRQII